MQGPSQHQTGFNSAPLTPKFLVENARLTFPANPTKQKPAPNSNRERVPVAQAIVPVPQAAPRHYPRRLARIAPAFLSYRRRLVGAFDRVTLHRGFSSTGVCRQAARDNDACAAGRYSASLALLGTNRACVLLPSPPILIQCSAIKSLHN